MGWYSKLGSQLPLWNGNLKKKGRKTYWHFYMAKRRLNCTKKLKMHNLCHFQITDLFQIKRSQPCARVIPSFKKQTKYVQELNWNVYEACYTCATLTLNSVDTPLSVSRRELQGNCPVTLYTLTEKLKHNITGRFERATI